MITREDFDKAVKDVVHEHATELKIEWTVGGLEGGSCWDTESSAYHPITPEPEPEFEELDELLNKLAPNMTFLKYKRLYQKNVKLESNSDSSYSDYYGNSQIIARKSIQLEDLFEYLNETE